MLKVFWLVHFSKSWPKVAKNGIEIHQWTRGRATKRFEKEKEQINMKWNMGLNKFAKVSFNHPQSIYILHRSKLLV